MKKVLALLLFCLIVSESKAQITKIHLKNGSSVKGELIEFKQGEFISVKIFDNHIGRFALEDVSKYRIKSRKSEFGLPDLGYFNYTSLGFLFVENDWGGQNAHFTGHTVNGWRFEQFTSTGLGIGLDRYGQVTALPIYASIRRDLFPSRTTPNVYANIGYSVMWEEDGWDFWEEFNTVNGGLYWEIGGGIRINYSRTALFFNMGFKKQHAYLESFGDTWSMQETRKLRNINLTMGMEF